MSIAIDTGSTPVTTPSLSTYVARSPRAAWMTAAGLASLSAGAIHAAAIGVHAEHRPAALAFTVVAALQLAWGGLALVRSERPVAVVGAVINLALFAGWVLAKTKGISFVEGLEEIEPIQWADGLAAALALGSGLAAVVSFRSSPEPSKVPLIPLSAVAVVVAFVGIVGMVVAGTHVHAHGGTVETGSGAADHHSGTMDHDMSHDNPAGAKGATSPTTAADGHEHAHESAAVPPKPYDPTKPIDLSGVAGVTPEQQAEAENLLAVTILRLGKWSDPAVAEAAGFHTIGDGLTGTEHFINEGFIADDVQLDPDKPESLVYDVKNGKRTLAAAMYMAPVGTTLETTPKIGGSLIQWHIHDNLCFFPNNVLGGLTDRQGNCRPGLTKGQEIPMIHVWIRPHSCGPFAALEGIGGGTIADGETKMCDHAHGS